jgi:hypothetical protein
MASSVRCTGGASLSSATQPTITGNWTYGGWYKANAGQYGQGSDSALQGWGSTGGTSEGGGIVVSAAANTTMEAFVFRNGGAEVQTQTVLTASNLNWIAISLSHASGSASYTLRYRLENVTTWTQVILTLTTQITNAGSLFLGTDQFGESAFDCDVRDFFCQAVVMSDAALLTATQNIDTAPAGTNLHYLQLLNAGTATTNGGTAGNWTAVPTLQTAATQPAETVGTGCNVIGYHYVTA